MRLRAHPNNRKDSPHPKVSQLATLITSATHLHSLAPCSLDSGDQDVCISKGLFFYPQAFIVKILGYPEESSTRQIRDAEALSPRHCTDSETCRAQSRGPCCTGEEQQGGVLPRPCRKGVGWGEGWGGGYKCGPVASAQGPALQLSTLLHRMLGFTRRF